MALTPAKFGRALNFGKANPLPMWTKSHETEYVFPHALGWSQVLQVEVIDFPPDFHFGVPFLDFTSEIRTTLGFVSRIQEFISRRAGVSPFIERISRMASSRITRTTRE